MASRSGFGHSEEMAWPVQCTRAVGALPGAQGQTYVWMSTPPLPPLLTARHYMGVGPCGAGGTDRQAITKGWTALYAAVGRGASAGIASAPLGCGDRCCARCPGMLLGGRHTLQGGGLDRERKSGV